MHGETHATFERRLAGELSHFGADDVIAVGPAETARRMTRNQSRAVAVATQLLTGQLDESEVTDADWHLLLLGAGLNNPQARTALVAERVLRRAARRAGYFAAEPTHAN